MQIANKIVGSLVTAGAVALSPLALAQMSSHAAAASEQDTTFVAKASAGGMTEVQAGKLADSQTQSAKVKSFAAMMVADHTKAGDQLSSVTQKDGFTPSTGPTPAQQQELAHLQSLNGVAFDKAYTAMMLKDHRETIALFKQEAAAGKNADLKSFASKTLPTLEHHLDMAEKL